MIDILWSYRYQIMNWPASRNIIGQNNNRYRFRFLCDRWFPFLTVHSINVRISVIFLWITPIRFIFFFSIFCVRIIFLDIFLENINWSIHKRLMPPAIAFVVFEVVKKRIEKKHIHIWGKWGGHTNHVSEKLQSQIFFLSIFITLIRMHAKT